MKPSKLPPPTEHESQVAVIDWWAYECKKHRLPEFALFCVPNAGAGSQRGQAGKMKAEGVRRGIPDLCLAVPSNDGVTYNPGIFHGLFIEMKRKGGKLSPEQREVHEYLQSAGYQVRTCYSTHEAITAITEYLA